MAKSFKLSALILGLAAIAFEASANDFTGLAKFYGGPFGSGTCPGFFNYPNYKTVKMNIGQYGGGFACGQCVKVCYLHKKKYCYNAVVSGACNDCGGHGCLGFGWAGPSTVPISWKCDIYPSCDVSLITQLATIKCQAPPEIPYYSHGAGFFFMLWLEIG